MNYSDETADEMARLQDEIDSENLWDSTARSTWPWRRLRCPPDDAMPENLSGDERRRVALCKLLLEAPDMLASGRAHQPPRRRDDRLASATSDRLQGHLPDRSPTTAISSTTSPAGFSSSTAAVAFPTRATIPHGSSRRPSGLSRKHARTSPSRRRSSASLNGSAPAPRRVRPSRRPGSTPTRNWPASPSARRSARLRSSSPTAPASARR